MLFDNVGHHPQVEIDRREEIAGLSVKILFGRSILNPLLANIFLRKGLAQVCNFCELADVGKGNRDLPASADQGKILGSEQFVHHLR